MGTALKLKPQDIGLDLPEQYTPSERQRGGLVSNVAGVTFRWVHPEKAYDWMDKGLRPVKKGSKLVRNDDMFDTLPDGTIRRGRLLLFCESEGNKRGRIQEQVKYTAQFAGEVANKAQEIQAEVDSIVADAGGDPIVGLEDYDGGTKIQREALTRDELPQGNAPKRSRRTKGADTDVTWGEGQAGASEESQILTGE